jgi:IS5 family transposase
MLGEIKSDFQQNLFKKRLKVLINLEQPLVKLADELSWDKMDIEFRNLYSRQRSSSIPIIKIAGLLLLKKRFNESDESVLDFSLNDF